MTTKITVPSADLDRNLELNMSEIAFAEGRTDEIATINSHKAPELLTCYIQAYTWCVEHITNLTAESIKAETAAEYRKAEILLEEVPRILREKGIKTANDDYRKAVVAMDKKHIALQERLNHIRMYVQMFKGKLESIEMAYMAVRKIYGSGMEFRNPNLGSNHTPDPWRPPVTPVPITVTPTWNEPNSTGTRPVESPTTTSIRAGFGRSRD